VFEILVRDNQATVRAFLLSAVRDPALADDLLQEAFLIAWKRLDHYDRTRPFGPWVRGIAAKLVLSHRRKVGRSKLFYVDEETVTALDHGVGALDDLPGDVLDDKLEALRTCMQQLSDNQRRTIAMHYEDGLQCKQIAPELGLGVEAVKKHLQRGRASLLRCIESQLGPDAELVLGKVES
jgi:RNA polymerase sigma-70 factor (ECF subfamily)